MLIKVKADVCVCVKSLYESQQLQCKKQSFNHGRQLGAWAAFPCDLGKVAGLSQLQGMRLSD